MDNFAYNREDLLSETERMKIQMRALVLRNRQRARLDAIAANERPYCALPPPLAPQFRSPLRPPGLTPKTRGESLTPPPPCMISQALDEEQSLVEHLDWQMERAGFDAHAAFEQRYQAMPPLSTYPVVQVAPQLRAPLWPPGLTPKTRGESLTPPPPCVISQALDEEQSLAEQLEWLMERNGFDADAAFEQLYQTMPPLSTYPVVQVAPQFRAPLRPLGLTPKTRGESLTPPPHACDMHSLALEQEESMIQQPGSRHSGSWSSDTDSGSNSSHSSDRTRTPPEIAPDHQSPESPQNVDVLPVSRSSARSSLSHERIDFSYSNPIRAVFRRPIDMALGRMSRPQLIHVIKNVINKHPEMENEVREIVNEVREMPKPDMAILEERLKHLKCNIFKSISTSRSTSMTDSAAFSRAEDHLEAFKKCVVDQGMTLVIFELWDSVVEYVLLAWDYVRATPVWDNIIHNMLIRFQLFNILINYCINAVKKGSLDRDTLIDLQEKLPGMIDEAPAETRLCMKHVQFQIEESPIN